MKVIMIIVLFFMFTSLHFAGAYDGESKEMVLRAWERACVQECRIKKYSGCEKIRFYFEQIGLCSQTVYKDHVHGVCPDAVSRYSHRLSRVGSIPEENRPLEHVMENDTENGKDN